MQELVQEALDNAEKEQREAELDTNEFGDPRIVIVGCGGAGNNSVDRLSNINPDVAETIAINTDKQHLQMIEADTKILIGKSLTEGLGAGGDPSIGERAAEMSRSTIKEILRDSDLVFITAGMGGGTGTGAAPVISKIAKEQGAVVIGICSTPFNVERARMAKAKEGLEKLQEEADSIVVLDNNQLLDHVPNLPIGKAFSVMDQIIAEAVKGISETITQPSLINLDYADVTTIMDQSGIATIHIGEAHDKNKSDEVVRDAIAHPLLDADHRGASGALVHITGGPDLSLREAEKIADKVTERIDTRANVIWGARIRDEHKGKVRVLAIMTGVQSVQDLNLTTQPKESSSSPKFKEKIDEGSISSSTNSSKVESDGGKTLCDQYRGVDVIR